MLGAVQRGDDEARVGLATSPLGLADDPALPAPAVQRRLAEVLEAACRLASCSLMLACRDQFGSDRARGARCGPGRTGSRRGSTRTMHQRLAGKPGIGAQQDARPRPAGADLADDARDLLDRPRAGVDVRAAQFGRQQMPAAEDVERQVAVAVVIAVEEAPFLVPMQRIVGGIEIEDDLPRRPDMGIEKQIDEQASIAGGSWPIL